MVQLEAHLAEVHRQSQRLIERQSKLGSTLSDFGTSMVALGRFESGTLAQKFTELGEKADTLSGACQVCRCILMQLSTALDDKLIISIPVCACISDCLQHQAGLTSANGSFCESVTNQRRASSYGG